MKRILSSVCVILLAFGALAPGDPVQLNPAQQDAANKLKAKGGIVMQIAADTDALVVGLSQVGKDITDADLALVKSLPKVQQLNLGGTSITDAGLVNIAGMDSLTELHLENTKITDAGLANLKGLTNLVYLNLYNTATTDAGLSNLQGLKNLKRVYLWETKVTDAGAAGMKAAVPGIVINRGEEATAALAAIQEAKAKEKEATEKAAADKVAAEKAASEKKAAADKAAAEKKSVDEKAAKTAAKPINDKCPVSDEPVDAKFTVVYEGKTIGFCCNKCPVEFQKDPKKYIAKLTAK